MIKKVLSAGTMILALFLFNQEKKPQNMFGKNVGMKNIMTRRGTDKNDSTRIH
jgi:hypothetical protein